MTDWQRFRQEVTWFLDPGDTVVEGEPQRWTRGPVDGLKELSALLHTATLTPVRVNNDAYELLAWGPPDDRRGWLCRPPHGPDGERVAPVHESFWAVCGGMVERFGEPTTWWTNQNEVLTAGAARVSVDEVVDELELPVNPDDYYVVAVEANGNLTLARRDDGRLLLFAPDHAFDRVTPVEGCPPYTLLTFDELPDLTAWIEVCAAAWAG